MAYQRTMLSAYPRNTMGGLFTDLLSAGTQAFAADRSADAAVADSRARTEAARAELAVAQTQAQIARAQAELAAAEAESRRELVATIAKTAVPVVAIGAGLIWFLRKGKKGRR